MRHRRRGRKLGRNPKHQRALLRNMVCDLVLTEREPDHPLFDKTLGGDPRRIPNSPRVRGRIVTTVAKAKELRPLVEKCVTIAKNSLPAVEAAAAAETDADRGSDAWKRWRQSDSRRQWNAATAPALAARRRLIQLLGNREVVSILIDEIAPRFVDRPGGYTRIVKLAKPRLGDAGDQAILEFVGRNDRVTTKSERPAFDADDTDGETNDAPAAQDETATQDAAQPEAATADGESSDSK
jgi:large subunit ribosomal protein L17